LQANRAKFNQHSVSSTCIVCKSDRENRIHLVWHCTTYTHIRDKHLILFCSVQVWTSGDYGALPLGIKIR
jgi:hypothetical protein